MNERPRPPATTVLIADDDMLARRAISDYLSMVEDFNVVAAVTDGAEAVEFITNHGVEMALLDVNMPRMDGIEAASLIHAASPGTMIIMLTSFDDDDLLRRALASGAAGYLLKNLRAAQLIAALRAARQGLPAVSPEMLASLRTRAAPANAFPALTPRETEVLEQLWAGRSNAQIAAALFISQSAVKAHVSSLMTKFGTQSRLETIARAHDLGFSGPH